MREQTEQADLRQTEHTTEPYPAPAVRTAAFLFMFVLPADVNGEQIRTFEGFTEPAERILVSAREPGPMAEVLVRRGDRVRRNDILFRLDDRILRKTRAAAEAEANSVAGTEALEIDRRSKERRYRSLLALHNSGSGSEEEVSLAKADLDIASKKVAAAKENHQIVVLKLQELDARIAQRKTESPIDGIVTDVRKKRGEFVAANDLHVVTVVQLKTLRAVFFLPTPIALQLKAAGKADLSLPLYGKQVAADVEYVAPVTEPDSGLVRVHLLIDNRKETVRSGIRCLFSAEDRQAPARSQSKGHSPDR